MKFETKHLGDYIKLQKGISYNGKNLVDESDIGMLTIDSFLPSGGYKRGSEKAFSGTYNPNFALSAGDLLFATTDVTQDGSVLCAPLLVPELDAGYSELVYSLDVARAESINKGLQLEFIYNFFRIPMNRYRAAYGDSGTTVRRISFDVIYEQKIPVPPIEVQGRINAFISNLDEQIQNCYKIRDSLILLAENLFREWIAVPCLNNSSSNVLEEPDEWIPPDEWGISDLGEYLTCLETGKRPAGGVKGILSGVPSVGAESINGIGVFDFNKTKFVPDGFVEKMKRGIPEDFDVLLYKDGGKPGEFLPRIGMYGAGFPFDKFVLNEHVFMLRSDMLGQPYLYFWIAQQGMMNRLAELGAKAAVPGINQEHVKSLKVVVPPSDVLQRFNELASSLIERALAQMARTVTLTKIRDELIPRLVDGRVRLPEVEVRNGS